MAVGEREVEQVVSFLETYRDKRRKLKRVAINPSVSTVVDICKCPLVD